MAVRFASLRKNHVEHMSKNPKSRPRHEKCDLALYTQKEETDYLDIFEDYPTLHGEISSNNVFRLSS